MGNRETSVAFLMATGLVPVELNPNDKSPTKGYSLVDIGRHDMRATINKFAMDPTTNLGALFSGTMVDIDVDSFDPFLPLALDKLLPPTHLVWGRKGKRRSHRIYKLDKDLVRAEVGRPLRVIKEMANVKGKSYSVEIRGGLTKEGMYTVLPGSFINLGPEANKAKGYDKEGEEIEWEQGTDPSVGAPIVPIHDLVKRIRMAQACSVIAPYWTPGHRNSLSMALAGLWWRISNLTMSLMESGGMTREEVPGMMQIDQQDCELMMDVICEICGDDEGDKRSRRLNLTNTWKKLSTDEGAKVTGGGAVAESVGDDGKEVVDALYKLLSDSPKLQEVEEWLDKLVLQYGKGRLIDLDLVREGEAEPWMARQEASNTFGREYLELYGQRIGLVDFLYSSKMVKYVRGLTLDPSDDSLLVEQQGKLYVNQWRGFDVKPHSEPVTAEYMAPLIDYFYNILASGNQDLGDWIMTWVAHIFKYPSTKSKTALVLVGDYGAGKTFLSEHIVCPLIGSYHSVSVQNVEDLTGRFNLMLDNKFFVAAHEALHKNKYISAQTLKAFITDDKISIEPKNVNRYEKPNFARFFFTSNNEYEAVFIEPSPNERRFTVVKVSDDKVGEQHAHFWKTLAGWMENNRPRILRWFLDYEVDMMLIRRPYYTMAKARLQTSSTAPELNWMIDRIIDGFPISKEMHTSWWQAFDVGVITDQDKKENKLNRTAWPDRFLWEALEEDFRYYFRKWSKANYRNNARIAIKELLPTDPIQLVQSDIRSRLPDGTLQIKRVRYYRMPAKQQIINHLKIKFGVNLINELLLNTGAEEKEAEAHREEQSKEKF